MALYYGGIDSASSWTVLVDYIKTIVTTHLGMTVVSDTGTNNARVLDVSATGYDHNIRFLYASYPQVSIVGMDGTTALYNGSFLYINPATKYYAINYNNTRALIICDTSGSWSPVFLLCKSGTRTHHIGTHTAHTNKIFYGIVSGDSDSVYTIYSGLYAVTGVTTLSGKDIVSPIILPYDENYGPLCDDCLNDFLACNSHVGAFTAKYAIGSAKYICVPVFNNTSNLMQYLMRYE